MLNNSGSILGIYNNWTMYIAIKLHPVQLSFDHIQHPVVNVLDTISYINISTLPLLGGRWSKAANFHILRYDIQQARNDILVSSVLTSFLASLSLST